MSLNFKGMLHESAVGGCANYRPDRDKPTGVLAEDVYDIKGEVFECLNCEPTKEAGELGPGAACGSIEFCVKYKARERMFF